jgi:hypothetical protein
MEGRIEEGSAGIRLDRFLADCGGEPKRHNGRRERAPRSEARARSEPTKRLARERVGESEGRSRSE